MKSRITDTGTFRLPEQSPGDTQLTKRPKQSFRAIFESSLLGIKSFDKPIWITEVGCPTGPDRPEWLFDLFSFMDDNPCVDALLWFNAHKTNEPDFRIESDSGSLGVVREWLRR